MSKLSLPLSPMLTQYLVGLCCLRWHPDAVNITVGDMVMDPIAGKGRDVDVTVTITESGNVTHAFKAYEVKHEGHPLDVAAVEQLCLKLMDMPSLTHKAIVSSSGFTKSAQSKAAHHGITLYELCPWTRPVEEQFPVLAPMQGTPQECFPISQTLLCWINFCFVITAREAKGLFSVQANDKLFTKSGSAHPRYKTFSEYTNHSLLSSTEILFGIEPAVTLSRLFPVPHKASDGLIPAGPAWPHTHSLDVRGDEVYVDTGDGIYRIDLLTINGHLQWQRGESSLYYVVNDIVTGEALAGALIAKERREGHMVALVLSPKSREIGIHFVRLEEKHLNCIRDLTIERPNSSETPASH